MVAAMSVAKSYIQNFPCATVLNIMNGAAQYYAYIRYVPEWQPQD